MTARYDIPGTIIMNDRDQPACDIHGATTIIHTDIISESGSRLVRCVMCRASAWWGV